MIALAHSASRRRLAATAGLVGAWAVLACVTTFDAGGEQATSVAVLAATLPLAALAAVAVLVARGTLAPLRAPRALWVMLGCLAAWAAVSFASMSWSLAPAASWRDAMRELAALAAVAAGAIAGARLARPLEATCLALVAAAVP